MNPTDKAARVAGALYLLVGLSGPFTLLYLPGKLIVPGDAGATARNILASEMLFRVGIAVGLISTLAFLAAVLALYRLLSGVNKNQASLMVILALLSVPIAFFNAVSEIAVLKLLHGADYLSVFDRHQLEALAMVFLGLRQSGWLVSEILWGLWLFPFGVLVIRSGFLPRILGILLLLNGCAYVVVSLMSLVLPAYASVVSRPAFIAELGELWIMLWLLIKGAKVQPLAAAAS